MATSRIPAMLARYSDWLTDSGVFIVRWHDPEGGRRILHLMNGRFEIAETYTGPQSGSIHCRVRKTVRVRLVCPRVVREATTNRPLHLRNSFNINDLRTSDRATDSRRRRKSFVDNGL